jgi:hypothetical protein
VSWSRDLGEKHGQRDRAASLQAQALGELEQQRHEACLQRWPTLVAALTAVVGSYNEGAGLDAVTLVEDATQPGVTLAPAGNRDHRLIIVLDGVDLAVRNGASDSVNGTRWVTFDRTDEDTAAYLLRDWLERL